MPSIFSRKGIADLLAEGESPSGLRRTLGVGDLVMLSIGAVIGAGIFSTLGTAAAGEVNAAGEVVRYGAGPALILSFVLLGVVCGFAALRIGTWFSRWEGRRRRRLLCRPLTAGILAHVYYVAEAGPER